MKWNIGCSGFYYKEWKDFFYPKGLAQKDWFKFYCKHFNTIEINASFYKAPTAKSLEKWFNDSPTDFVFTMKAPRLITHYKQFNYCKTEATDFYQLVNDGLKEKLACVLFQFPPSFSYTEEKLERLLQTLNPGFKNVVEFRHASWWNEKVFALVKAHHIIFAGQSYPKSLPDDVITTHPAIYYRFHGKPVLYKSAYDFSEIEHFFTQIPADADQAFIYFNNTWGFGAINNANQLKLLVENG
ncbi:DUF72 domain-containing protein [Pedobacter nanyangensis]|uniref:DUF72 domain-containing protein n=1 Tax=Pedobacter nanyangensis TaxID=1562389 RepID=UPI000DE1D8C7|nr:DUF72 domain-containing protein [Pedobacter nanyangensis]